MAEKRLGARTIKFTSPVYFGGTATIVGRKEGEGPLGALFDEVEHSNTFGGKSFEQGEAKMMQRAARLALKKASLANSDVDLYLAGDLLNQIITANYSARDLSIPFFGAYGACSTFCEVLTIGSVFIDGGYCDKVLVAASSHHDTAERQYRYPTEFGGQRPPEAQWTVTGAGAAILDKIGSGPQITCATIGSVIDMGIRDANNMGAAMAPAAANTIASHLRDTARSISNYDVVATGDLGHVGHDILIDLMKQQGVRIPDGIVTDCGMLIYTRDQDTHAGGSGCGCGTVTFLSYLLDRLKKHEISRVLLVATGALHSPCSVQQGESIPGIAHAVAIEWPKAGGTPVG